MQTQYLYLKKRAGAEIDNLAFIGVGTTSQPSRRVQVDIYQQNSSKSNSKFALNDIELSHEYQLMHVDYAASGRNYRYGFNGMEADDELKGSGNSYDFGARMYDARVGSFLSLDAYESKYPYYFPYSFAGNTPILDNNGDSVWVYSEAFSNSFYLGRHMLMRVKTADFDVLIELGGAKSPSSKGKPKIYPFAQSHIDSSDYVESHQVFEPINKLNEDKFERDILAYAGIFKAASVYNNNGVYIDNTLLPINEKWGPNSNGFVIGLITLTGGHLELPDMDANWYTDTYGNIVCLPGTDWENFKPYIIALQTHVGEDEYYLNTFGITKVDNYSALAFVNKINEANSSENTNPSSSPADNTTVNNAGAAKLNGPARRKLKKSGNV